ncbi:MAG: c-type cytochrome domain-containing protein [Kofleriaceae bacterium]
MSRTIWILVAVIGCAPARADQPIGGAAVLQKYCAKCHGAAKAEGDLSFITDTPRLVAEGMIVPGDAKRSLVYQRVAAGEMPPESVKARPSPEELVALREWIDKMATAAPVVTLRSDRDIGRAIAADEARLAYGARAHARWFTLGHLAAAGAPEAQLERHRVALATLLGSLTWSATAPVPVAIDAERTIFRIDLRDLGWTAATWDAIRASYPYGIARGAGIPDSIRADWFVATASRPPLYHTLLEMPATEADLGRRLGIDLADNIQRDHVARAGFNRSGVSVNNRVIERHATRHGAYWRSYDFSSSVGRENVFANPLGFVPAGGEIIFNLPDGFQAYMLVDARGRRIDKAPTTIVSDPRRPDRAVETGVSCIGCHASGIVAKPDQIRAIANTFARDDRDRILRLHPGADAMTALYDRDRARFTQALASIGAKPNEPADEPIAALVTRDEAELERRLAAAELGLRADELQARITRSYSLRQTLGALANEGGTIKRDTWAAAFPRVLDELGIGVPFTPRDRRDAGPAVWVDRDRASWIALATRTDQATALAVCRNRGYALPRSAELVTAVANGLSAGLQLRGTLWTSTTKLDASNLRYAAVVDPVTGTSRRADVVDRHDVVCVQR